MNNLFFPFVITALISICLGYPAMFFARRFNLIDIPGSASHKAHAHPTPLAGGLLIASATVIMAVVFHAKLGHEVQVVLAGAAIIFIFGLWDDIMGLSAAPKLIGQFIAVAVLIFFRVQVNFIGTLAFAANFPLWMTYFLNISITLFWVVGITNAVNMIDSMDGIVAGLSMIEFVCFMVATKLSHQLDLSFWAAVFLGISIGLYFWNRMPAKFFLGDSGAQTIGFLLASFGMMYNPRNFHPESSWVVPIMLLSIPIFDTTLVVISRLRRGQSVKRGRRDHTYHRLVAFGFSPKHAVLITHLTAFVVSCLAFLTLYLPPLIALIFFLLTMLCGILCLFWLERKPTLDDQVEQNDNP